MADFNAETFDASNVNFGDVLKFLAKDARIGGISSPVEAIERLDNAIGLKENATFSPLAVMEKWVGKNKDYEKGFLPLVEELNELKNEKAAHVQSFAQPERSADISEPQHGLAANFAPRGQSSGRS